MFIVATRAAASGAYWKTATVLDLDKALEVPVAPPQKDPPESLMR